MLYASLIGGPVALVNDVFTLTPMPLYTVEITLGIYENQEEISDIPNKKGFRHRHPYGRGPGTSPDEAGQDLFMLFRFTGKQKSDTISSS